MTAVIQVQVGSAGRCRPRHSWHCVPVVQHAPGLQQTPSENACQYNVRLACSRRHLRRCRRRRHRSGASVMCAAGHAERQSSVHSSARPDRPRREAGTPLSSAAASASTMGRIVQRSTYLMTTPGVQHHLAYNTPDVQHTWRTTCSWHATCTCHVTCFRWRMAGLCTRTHALLVYMRMQLTVGVMIIAVTQRNAEQASTPALATGRRKAHTTHSDPGPKRLASLGKRRT